MRQGRGRDVVRVDCCRRNVSEGECVASAGTYRKANVFQKIHKNFQINFFKIIIYTIIIISLYESLTALIIIIFNLVPMTFYKLFYKITHSLIINIIYIEFIYLILKIIPKKFKKISIN